ncbi:thiamine pyrophosphate-binding protein [Pseudoalteromonas sp. KG3]|uniref:Ubiquinone-dependent pyruvate dehydrogenase n=1 Tax=Pseudoalteromonas prydzensis TaxID=182141 RepID=A0ABR9FL70_9GAMM|nr:MULTISPECIES: thiamine pyrophosphate-dependent enzyme [Pseudoalteromonas]MBE0457578.1 ubiquinone-dependent pyruvate dehydrogenase [Pseudoalteromonas prydzensis]WKD26086.1 thiamine pyrophosphate-binding protein [Pseudoalteromonas sp. KG3]
MSITVSEVIADTLIKAGAKRCYGIVGDTINHFTNAISKTSLEWINVRHEEVGAFAAGGEAYMTRQLAVCAGTCGPGSLHFVNGIFESHRNGSPVVLIASNVDSSEEGMGFPQELDQTKIYDQCSVFCQRINHPSQARRIVAQAAQAALTHQGVAVVVVNGDIFKNKIEDDIAWSVHQPQPVIRPNDADLNALAGMIHSAKRITIYAGIGAREAHDQLIALADKIKAPIAHSSRSKEFVEPNNPFNVGMTGILGNLAGMQAMDECDLLLCLGSDFAYTQFYPKNAQIVQVDTQAKHLGRRTPINLGLVGDVADTIEALLPLLEQRCDDSHLNNALEQWHKDKKEYEGKARHESELIHPQYLAQLLSDKADRNAIFTADGGSPMVWLLRHLEATGERRFLTSLLHGTMANAYPQALGIANAYPQRQVIAMCGDGGLTMLLGDLLTLVQEQIPVKLLVFNNESLGFVEMEQRVEGLLDNFTSLHNPNFALLAEQIGLQGWQVDTPERLPDTMQAWLDHKGPALLEVKVNRMELVMPPKIEANQVASTALFGIKAVLNGRSNEVISLIRDNFIK